MKTKCVRTLSAAAVAATVFGVLGGAGVTVAQQDLPTELWIPVTFYDFRSDRSNPEFEQPHGKPSGCTDNSSAASGACIRTGMVANTLDADNKPAVGPTPYRNYGIAHWFRDWNTYTAGPYSKGKNRAPDYTPTPGIKQTASDEWGVNVVYNSDKDVSHDTSFINKVFKDSLRFILQSTATGTYRFDRRGNNGFFPLDNKGFGNEWVVVDNARGNHNFAFTMEMAFPFTAKERMSFNFSGDDDVWVFIDKQLVLDLGGIHSEQSKSFNISDVPGIVYGRGYTLRIFYAERHSSASNILIETNIVAPPAGIGISTQDNTGKGGMVGKEINKNADDSLKLYSVVRNEAGDPLTPGADYDCNLVVWSVGGKEIGKGCEITVRDSVARSVDITVTYKPADGGAPITGSTNLNVKALPPTAIHIQKESEPKDPTAKGGLSDDIYFNVGDDNIVVYAVLRDKYGNFVGYATKQGTESDPNKWWSTADASWASRNEDVATVSPKDSYNPTVRKEFMGEGTSDYLVVTYSACTQRDGCVTLIDSVRVGSKSKGQVAIGPNPFIPGPGGVSIGESLCRDKGGSNDPCNFYQDAIRDKGGRGAKGVLISVNTPGELKEGGAGPDKDRRGRVMIYDAVGNVVVTDRLFKTIKSSTYGFVWDGKNAKGRLVGPGTYLVCVTGELKSGEKVKLQRMVGVKK